MPVYSLGGLTTSHFFNNNNEFSVLTVSFKKKVGVEEKRRWGAVMIFGDANLKSSFA